MKKESKILDFISRLSNNELWEAYVTSVNSLKEREEITSSNVVGDRGENLAISIYNKTPGETNLQKAPKGTRNVDALSKMGDRYSIKTVTYPRSKTGVFWGMNEPDSEHEEDRKFEYVIIVVVDSNLQPKNIMEINWKEFLKLRRWDSRMKTWCLHITKEFQTNARAVYTKE